MVHVVSYDLQHKHCICERRVEVIIGFDTGDPSGCTQSNQRLLFPVFRMLILDDGSQQTISLGAVIEKEANLCYLVNHVLNWLKGTGMRYN